MTAGPERDLAELRRPHPAARVQQYVPLDELLPACEEAVCHAGWRTTIAALAHGLPMVLVPIAADQPAIAGRCDAAGVGVTVAPADVGSGAVVSGLTTVLDGEAHRANAERVSAEIRGMPSPDDVARQIGTLVG